MNYIELKKFTLAHSKILNIDDKAKIKEQYEIIINISMQEINRLKLYLNILEETLKHNCSVEFNPDEFNQKEFIIYLCRFKKGYYNNFYMCQKYSSFAQDLEDIYNVGGNEIFYYDNSGRKHERYFIGEFRELMKQEIKETKKKINQEKLKMSLSLRLPDHLIYEVEKYL